MRIFVKQKGVTLLEVMLVLAIGSFILLSGLRVYNAFQIDQDIAEIKGHVDILFLSLTNFVRANCSKNKNYLTDQVLKWGLLDPSQFTGDQYKIESITDELSRPGFLSRWPFPQNRLINNDATDPNKGYAVHLDRVTQDRLSPARPVGKIVLWKGVVAVRMRSPAAAKAYQQVFSARCTARLNPDTAMVGCEDNITKNLEYIVWERTLSFGSEQATSDLWPSMPLVGMFTQMYTTYPVLMLTNGSKTAEQYYLCGG